MKRSIKYNIFLSIVVLLSTACLLPQAGCTKNSSPTQIVSNDHQSDTTYIGSWNWVKSIGGFAGGTRTPASEGYNIKIVLKTDSTFELYDNDTLNATTKYYIRREKPYSNSDSIYIIHYRDSIRFHQQFISLIGYDTLNLVDQCMDCYNSFYSRIK
jgi:hypothetical protein